MYASAFIASELGFRKYSGYKEESLGLKNVVTHSLESVDIYPKKSACVWWYCYVTSGYSSFMLNAALLKLTLFLYLLQVSPVLATNLKEEKQIILALLCLKEFVFSQNITLNFEQYIQIRIKNIL